MGLDIYVYRLYKPRETVDELRQKSIDELEEFLFFEKGVELPDNFDAVRRFAVEVVHNVDYVKIGQIRRDYKIPNDARMTREDCRSADTMGYTFELPSCGGRKDIEIPINEFESKYIHTEKQGMFYIACEIICDWGKRHDISKAFRDACDAKIKNDGYYPFNDKMWDVLRRYAPEEYADVERYRNDTDCVVCYSEDW